MFILIGIVALIPSFYYCVLAIARFKLIRYGVHTTATVVNIEKIKNDEEDAIEKYICRLHIELAKENGRQLGKLYEKPIDPRKYWIGEEVEMIQSPEAPTEFVLKKEMSFLNTPKAYLFYALLFFICSYFSCNIIG